MTEGWWKYAKPGDKVVCVDDFPDRFMKPGVLYFGDLDGLQAGVVYTVHHIGPQTQGTRVGEAAVWVTEINRPMGIGYHPDRFRPVQTKSTETGMTILKAILHGAPVKEDA